MKYDCSDEFDLSEIFRKLTSCAAPTRVAACDFFGEQPSLAHFQQAMDQLVLTRL